MNQEKLRLFIKSEGMTQSAFAKLCGLRDVDVSRILSGKRGPTLKQAAKIESVTQIGASSWVESEAA